jgi:hypothetical protein
MGELEVKWPTGKRRYVADVRGGIHVECYNRVRNDFYFERIIKPNAANMRWSLNDAIWKRYNSLTEEQRLQEAWHWHKTGTGLLETLAEDAKHELRET